jgi:hypothetical protein
VGDLLAPIQWGTPVLRVATAPPLSFPALPAPSVAPRPAPPAAAPLAVAGGGAEPARRRRRRRHLVLVAAALLVIVPGAASAALLTPGPPRPVLADVVAYHDRAAGFSMLYPRSWRVARADPGQGLRLLAGPVRVPDGQRASVSVVTGTEPSPLPSLADFEAGATTALGAQYPGLRLADGADTTVAGGVGRRASFTDASSPLTALEVEGRTADGRPLTVTVVTPDPQHAPSSADLHDFLASIR